MPRKRPSADPRRGPAALGAAGQFGAPHAAQPTDPRHAGSGRQPVGRYGIAAAHHSEQRRDHGEPGVGAGPLRGGQGTDVERVVEHPRVALQGGPGGGVPERGVAFDLTGLAFGQPQRGEARGQVLAELSERQGQPFPRGVELFEGQGLQAQRRAVASARFGFGGWQQYEHVT